MNPKLIEIQQTQEEVERWQQYHDAIEELHAIEELQRRLRERRKVLLSFPTQSELVRSLKKK